MSVTDVESSPHPTPTPTTEGGCSLCWEWSIDITALARISLVDAHLSVHAVECLQKASCHVLELLTDKLSEEQAHILQSLYWDLCSRWSLWANYVNLKNKQQEYLYSWIEPSFNSLLVYSEHMFWSAVDRAHLLISCRQSTCLADPGGRLNTRTQASVCSQQPALLSAVITQPCHANLCPLWKQWTLPHGWLVTHCHIDW